MTSCSRTGIRASPTRSSTRAADADHGTAAADDRAVRRPQLAPAADVAVPLVLRVPRALVRAAGAPRGAQRDRLPGQPPQRDVDGDADLRLEVARPADDLLAGRPADDPQ